MDAEGWLIVAVALGAVVLAAVEIIRRRNEPSRPAPGAGVRRTDDATPLFPRTLELADRRYLRTPGQGRLLLLAVVLASITLALPFLLIGADPGRIDWGALAERLGQKLFADPLNLAMQGLVLAAIAFQLASLRYARRDRLILSRGGIEFRSAWPGMLRRFRPSWSANWTDIRAVRLGAMKGSLAAPQFVHLELETAGGRRRLHPWHWVEAAAWRPPSVLGQLRLTRPDAAAIREEIGRSPLVRYLHEAGLPLNPPGLDLPMPFALEKNPRALTVAMLFFALVAYGLADFALNSETYAEGAFPLAYVAGGVLTAFAALWWLRGGRVPWAESLVVALLTGGAFGAALYPGLLRLNELTDREGLRSYDYVLQPDLSLRPREPGLPRLRLGDPDYWINQRPGSLHVFELRKGGLGFYQVDLRRYHEERRAYYEQRSQRRDSR